MRRPSTIETATTSPRRVETRRKWRRQQQQQGRNRVAGDEGLRPALLELFEVCFFELIFFFFNFINDYLSNYILIQPQSITSTVQQPTSPPSHHMPPRHVEMAAAAPAGTTGEGP